MMNRWSIAQSRWYERVWRRTGLLTILKIMIHPIVLEEEKKQKKNYVWNKRTRWNQRFRFWFCRKSMLFQGLPSIRIRSFWLIIDQVGSSCVESWWLYCDVNPTNPTFWFLRLDWTWQKISFCSVIRNDGKPVNTKSVWIVYRSPYITRLPAYDMFLRKLPEIYNKEWNSNFMVSLMID